MSIGLKNIWVKATRKRHVCKWCGTGIDVGSTANYQSCIFEGEFFAGYYHPECRAAMDAMPYSELQDGWCAGDFSRGRKDDEKAPPDFSPDYRGRDGEARDAVRRAG